MERRKFTREFKLEAVRLIRDRGVSYTQAARDLRPVRPSPVSSITLISIGGPCSAALNFFRNFLRVALLSALFMYSSKLR